MSRCHHALRAEHLGQLADQLGTRQRGGVDRDLVGAGVEHGLGVVRRADPAADHERDEHVVGGPPRQLDDRLAPLVRGGDVEEHQLVGALGVVASGQLHRVAGVAQADEVGPLDHPALVHVETGDDALQGHAARVAAARRAQALRAASKAFMPSAEQRVALPAR